MTSDLVYDAIVVGGGLAGAAAGYHLARKGYRALILEQEIGPHHKICGEFLSAEALPYLQEIGVDLDKLGALSITKAKLCSTHVTCDLLFPIAGKSISRFVLDEACLTQSMMAGCRVRRGEKVTSVDYSVKTERYSVKTEQNTYISNSLFWATGKHEQKIINPRFGRDNSAIAFKMHWQLSDIAQKRLSQDVVLCFFGGGYAGVSAIEGGRTNLCFIIHRAAFNKIGKSYEACLSYLQKKPYFKRIFSEAYPLWDKPLAMAGVPYGHLSDSNKSTKSGFYILGDQFAVVPSLAGSGMTIALYSARTAVEQFHDSGPSGVHAYTKKCRKALFPSFRRAYPLHIITRSRLGADISLGLAKAWPKLANNLMHNTRCPTLGQGPPE